MKLEFSRQIFGK